jgi:hypothetical protein
VFNRTGDIHPSITYVSQGLGSTFWSDPVRLRTGTADYTGNNGTRWGDVAGACVDFDDSHVWVYNEYKSSAHLWSTFAAEIG